VSIEPVRRIGEKPSVLLFLYKVEVGLEEGGDKIDLPFFVHGNISCQIVYKILKYPHGPFLRPKYESSPNKKYFGVLPPEPSPFKPAHIYSIPNAFNREAFREL